MFLWYIRAACKWVSNTKKITFHYSQIMNSHVSLSDNLKVSISIPTRKIFQLYLVAKFSPGLLCILGHALGTEKKFWLNVAEGSVLQFLACFWRGQNVEYNYVSWFENSFHTSKVTFSIVSICQNLSELEFFIISLMYKSNNRRHLVGIRKMMQKILKVSVLF